MGLIGELDRGGMGVVYAAEDLSLGREVAIKVPGRELLRADAAARLEREARILGALEHPGIVPVHDSGTLPDGRAYYVMKRVRGARLDEVMESGILLPDALRLFARICDPVAFAHSRSVIHRDLKPANVMVGEFGEVLVLDWGVAKLLTGEAHDADGFPRRAATLGAPMTSDGEVIGTHGYMSPEQERGDVSAIGPCTDVWALGVILRDLAAQACSRSDQRVPKALDAVVRKAMAADPGDRYASAADLAADVVRFADGGSVSAYREPPHERALRWIRRNKTAVAVVLAYLVMRVLIYIWFGR